MYRHLNKSQAHYKWIFCGQRGKESPGTLRSDIWPEQRDEGMCLRSATTIKRNLHRHTQILTVQTRCKDICFTTGIIMQTLPISYTKP